MNGPLIRDCPLCGERHDAYEYTLDDVAQALDIIDGLDMEQELRPVAELLGLVLLKLGACPLCRHVPIVEGADCGCECHAEDYAS